MFLTEGKPEQKQNNSLVFSQAFKLIVLYFVIAGVMIICQGCSLSNSCSMQCFEKVKVVRIINGKQFSRCSGLHHLCQNGLEASPGKGRENTTKCF